MLLFAGTAVLLVLLLAGGAFALLSSRGEEGSGSSGHQPRGTIGGPDKAKGNGTTVYTPDSSTTEEETVDLSNDTSPPAERTTDTESTFPGSKREDQVREAVDSYYNYGVHYGDWAYTYEHLDSETQSRFSEKEWGQKNQWLADHYPATYRIRSVNVDSSEDTITEVKVEVTGEDGSSTIRNTYFVYEDGSWKHRFGQEENDLLMPNASYEQFVEAQQ